MREGDLVLADASEDYAGIGKSVEVMNVGGRQIVAGLKRCPELGHELQAALEAVGDQRGITPEQERE